jgi:hypothetical protein
MKLNEIGLMALRAEIALRSSKKISLEVNIKK